MSGYRTAAIRDAGMMIRGVGVLLAVCCSVALAASDLRKPAPDETAQTYRERLTDLVKARYPQLLTQQMAGTPVVTMLFEADGNVVQTRLDVRSPGKEALTASEEQFYRFGPLAGRLRYIGESRIELPVNTVLVVFGGLDTRNVDRALVESFFPQVLAKGTRAHEGIWILFDHQGRMLRAGEERFDTASLRSLLEKRYRGIRTSDMTLTPVIGGDGRPIRNSSGNALRLHSVWLAAGSPLPETSTSAERANP